MLFALRFVRAAVRSGATVAALSLITFVAGVNVRKCPPSRRFSPNELLPVMSFVLFIGAGLLSVRWGGTVTNPKRKVAKLPPGLPPGVTYAS